MTEIRGITWDHPRGVLPLRAASDQYAQDKGVTVSWAARPLSSFEDTPLSELAESFDLLAIDHPSIGDALNAGALLPFENFLSDSQLEDRARDAAGASHSSYQREGRQWALAFDAACMVSAFRSDKIDVATAPTEWSELTALSKSLGRERVLIAANPTHLFCTFLSLCEVVSPVRFRQADGRPAWWTDDGIAVDVAEAAIEMLREVLDACSIDSLNSDPISVLDRLGSEEIVYVPLVFGYVTYSLKRANLVPVTFVDAPGMGGDRIGTLTGGVGLAVSAHSRQPAAAADFARFATEKSVQCGVFASAGGQPARASAWLSPDVNEAVGNFFSNTLRTLDLSFVRPRAVGYPRFQSEAGAALHSMFIRGSASAEIVREISALWGQLVAVR